MKLCVADLVAGRPMSSSSSRGGRGRGGRRAPKPKWINPCGIDQKFIKNHALQVIICRVYHDGQQGKLFKLLLVKLELYYQHVSAFLQQQSEVRQYIVYSTLVKSSSAVHLETIQTEQSLFHIWQTPHKFRVGQNYLIVKLFND